MSLKDHVVLDIVRGSVGISRPGFGVPLILSVNAPFPELIRFYTDITSVEDDGFATDSPEYLAAAAMFSQELSPERIAIGRGTNKPTQKYEVRVATVRNDYTYEIKVVGEGVTTTTASFLSGPAADNDTIVAGLVASLNAVVGKNYTASAIGGAGVQTVEVVGDAPGNWFSLEMLNVQDLESTQTHADPGIANDLNAIQLVNKGWYALYTLYNSEAYVIAAADWVATQTKIYAADSSDSECVTTPVGNGDTLDIISTAAYARTFGNYHPSSAEMFGAAWLGRCLPTNPGSITWKFKTLQGVLVPPLTETHRINLTDRNGNSYEEAGGINITFEGTTGDGDFIDIQRGIDWLEADMKAGVFGAKAGAGKIPFTDDGVVVIESEVRSSLNRAINRGILAEDPEPVVTVPAVADVSDADKSARILPDVKFSATLAGAIHKTKILGVVSA